jgi:peptide/nickel transport system permease protein
VAAWARLRLALESRLARVGLGLLAVAVLTAVVGPFVAPGDGDLEAMLAARDTGPSWSHPFGTTIQGLDVLSQVLHAIPLTLELVAGATAIALLIAVACGISAGAFGGRFDDAVGALTAVFLVVPMLPLAIVIAGALPRQRHTAVVTMLMIGLSSWAVEARVLRAQALSLRNAEFVAAARVVGESRWRLVLVELVPNMAARIGAGVFLVAIQATITLSTLDFLASFSRGRFALGDTNGSTLGSVLALAQMQQALLTGSWWAFAFPALALLVVAAGLVLTMIGLEQAADPRLRVGLAPQRTFAALRSLAAWRPRAPRPRSLASPLPRLRDVVGVTPHLLRHLLRRAPLYVFALWAAVTAAYALPRLAWRGNLVAPPPSGSFLDGYGHFVGEVGRGRIGLGVPGVGQTVRDSLPFSLALVGSATLIAFAIGCVLGLAAAWRRGRIFDGSVTTATAVLWTAPAFAVAGLAVSFLALRLRLFPIQWAYAVDLEPAWSWRFVGSAFRHGELPLLVLVVTSLGLWVLSMRAVAIPTLSDDYVLFARACGIRESRIMVRYAGRNALLPILTGFAVAFSLAIGGVPALEEVFSYAGGGWELQQAAVTGNFPLVQALFVAIALSVVAVNVAVDAFQVVLDPRLRTG